jgi:hypothetical protein
MPAIESAVSCDNVSSVVAPPFVVTVELSREFQIDRPSLVLMLFNPVFNPTNWRISRHTGIYSFPQP